MTREAAKAYAETIHRVCDYIDRHLDQRLSVEQLSRVANFSKYHFHRQFLAYTGVNVYRFVQLMRLKRASYRLAFDKQRRVIDIAMDAGFETPESFARAFKREVGQTPSQFRKAPGWEAWTERFQFATLKRERKMDVKIIEFDETRVAALEHRGAPERVLDSAATFIAWRKETGLSPVRSSRTFGIPYDDPRTTPPEAFRFDICGAVDADVPDNPQGVVTKVIPGGRCAVLRHLGSHDDIATSVDHLYGEWLPASGEALRDFPCFFHYVNLIPDVPEHELVTDIHLPLK